MRVYVFGNRDYEPDAIAFEVVEKIKMTFRQSGSSHLARSAQAFGSEPQARRGDSFDLNSLSKLSGVEFVEVKPNEDLPFVNQEMVVIMDVVEGIDKVTLITEEDLDKLVVTTRSSAHDYDLGFQLKYLLKLGKLKKVRIVGLPMRGRVEIEEVTKCLLSLSDVL